jgi:hypothetical protein
VLQATREVLDAGSILPPPLQMTAENVLLEDEIVSQWRGWDLASRIGVQGNERFAGFERVVEVSYRVLRISRLALFWTIQPFS